jgi:methylmalonyl-CoA mutase, N-terminal domain
MSAFVSTGSLPPDETVQRLVSEAHERFRGNSEGSNAEVYPALAAVPQDRHVVGVHALPGKAIKREIEEAAYREAKRIEAGEQVVVGVNRFAIDEEEPVEILKLDPELQRGQAEKLAQIRANRDAAAVKEALEDIRDAARSTDNILPPIKEAFRRMATLGEVCYILRDDWGSYVPESTL